MRYQFLSVVPKMLVKVLDRHFNARFFKIKKKRWKKYKKTLKNVQKTCKNKQT